MAAIEAGVIAREIAIAAPPETVFEFFTDPQKMARWKGRKADLDPRPGGLYRVEIDGDNIARGEYVEVTPYERVVFTWGWEGAEHVPPGSSTVEVNLVPDGKGTVVHLLHRDLPDAALALHQDGWDRFLPQLVAAAAQDLQEQ